MNHLPIAIIPARGGSKRIPRKNIKLFLEHPIIKYTIDAALNSRIFQSVIVSTDDPEIARVAKDLGAEVPFLRSTKNSGDFVVISDVIEEVLGEMEKLGKKSETFCCLFPTAPFVTDKRLQLTWDIFSKNDVDFLFPVCQFSYPPQRAVRVSDNRLKMIQPEHLNTRSQDLEPIYHDVGQFYWGKSQSIKRYKSFLLGEVYPYVIDEIDCQDIDNVTDWEIAELKYKLKQSPKKL